MKKAMTEDYLAFLTEGGKVIFNALKAHCEKYKLEDIDHYELGMLANAFDLYSRCAVICNTGELGNKHDQIKPEYSVMKDCYDKILKHGGKFGLNPADRAKFFKGGKAPKKAFA